MYVCMFVCACLFVCMYVHMYVRMFVCMCVCIRQQFCFLKGWICGAFLVRTEQIGHDKLLHPCQTSRGYVSYNLYKWPYTHIYIFTYLYYIEYIYIFIYGVFLWLFHHYKWSYIQPHFLGSHFPPETQAVRQRQCRFREAVDACHLGVWKLPWWRGREGRGIN